MLLWWTLSFIACDSNNVNEPTVFTKSYPNGQVAIQGLSLEDSPTGDWTEWYDDGTVKATYTFSCLQLHCQLRCQLHGAGSVCPALRFGRAGASQRSLLMKAALLSCGCAATAYELGALALLCARWESWRRTRTIDGLLRALAIASRRDTRPSRALRVLAACKTH